MKEIFKTRDHLEKVWECINSIKKDEFVRSKKNRFVGTMLYVTLNHSDAIQSLVQQGNLPSSQALLRPLIETGIRAFWINQCASDEQVERRIDTDSWGAVEQMLEELLEVASSGSILTKIWKETKFLMHSMTHGGVEISLRQLSEDGVIGSKPDESEVLHLVQMSTLMSWLVLAEFIEITSSDHLTSKLLEMGEAVGTWAFSSNRKQD